MLSRNPVFPIEQTCSPAYIFFLQNMSFSILQKFKRQHKHCLTILQKFKRHHKHCSTIYFDTVLDMLF